MSSNKMNSDVSKYTIDCPEGEDPIRFYSGLAAHFGKMNNDNVIKLSNQLSKIYDSIIDLNRKFDNELISKTKKAPKSAASNKTEDQLFIDFYINGGEECILDAIREISETILENIENEQNSKLDAEELGDNVMEEKAKIAWSFISQQEYKDEILNRCNIPKEIKKKSKAKKDDADEKKTTKKSKVKKDDGEKKTTKKSKPKKDDEEEEDEDLEKPKKKTTKKKTADEEESKKKTTKKAKAKKEDEDEEDEDTEEKPKKKSKSKKAPEDNEEDEDTEEKPKKKSKSKKVQEDTEEEDEE